MTAFALLLCAGSAAAGAALRGSAPVGMSAGAAGPLDTQQLTQIVAPHPCSECASTKEDCFSKGCCNVVAFGCFLTTLAVDQFGTPNAKNAGMVA